MSLLWGFYFVVAEDCRVSVIIQFYRYFLVSDACCFCRLVYLIDFSWLFCFAFTCVN